MSIFADHLGAEIGVVDIQTNNVYVYGGDCGYSRRHYILYDGMLTW